MEPSNVVFSGEQIEHLHEEGAKKRLYAFARASPTLATAVTFVKYGIHNYIQIYVLMKQRVNA